MSFWPKLLALAAARAARQHAQDDHLRFGHVLEQQLHCLLNAADRQADEGGGGGERCGGAGATGLLAVPPSK